MKKLLLLTPAIALFSFANANAHDNLNLNLTVPVGPAVIIPVAPVGPVPVAPAIPYDQCTAQYNAIVNNEDISLQNCDSTYVYNPAQRDACEQNVLVNSNIALNNNTLCRGFYLQNSLIISFNINNHGHLARHHAFNGGRFHDGHDNHQDHNGYHDGR